MAALLLGIAIVACLELASRWRHSQIVGLRQAILGLRQGQQILLADARPKQTHSEVLAMAVCGTCMEGYGSHHQCEAPRCCDCDVTEQHEPLREYTAALLERALEFDPPTFDYVGESARARRRRMRNAEVVGLTPSPQFVPPVMNLDGPEEAIYELGSFEPVVLTCKHPDPVPVHLSDGALVAWICTRCQADGRFPWPEGH